MTVHCNAGSAVTGRTLWLSDPAQAFQGLYPVQEETPRRYIVQYGRRLLGAILRVAEKSNGVVTLVLIFSVLILLRSTT